VPYNYERLLHLVSGGDAAAVKQWVAAVGRGDAVVLPPRVAKEGFAAWGLLSCAVGAGRGAAAVNDEVRDGARVLCFVTISRLGGGSLCAPSLRALGAGWATVGILK
jgi:hypothetical protein